MAAEKKFLLYMVAKSYHFHQALKTMKTLYIIGNGFDMAHGLKTSYKDFINWYCNQRVDTFVGNQTKISEDCLCKLTINDNNNLFFPSFFKSTITLFATIVTMVPFFNGQKIYFKSFLFPYPFYCYSKRYF